MPITNGTLEYERRVKTGDFEHRHAKATISFNVENESDTLDKVGDQALRLAVSHVHRAVGLSTVDTPTTATIQSAPAQTETPTENKPSATRKRSTRLPADEKTEASAATQAATVTTQSVSTATSAADVSVVDDGSVATTQPAEESLTEALGVVDEVEPISDKELGARVMKFKAEHAHVTNTMVVSTMKKYAPSVSQIPQNLRQAFLDDLEKVAENSKPKG